MLVPRRSIAKFAAFALAAVPIPGTLQRILAPLDPEDQPIEDAAELLEALAARCAEAPIGEREAELVGSFLRLVRLPKRVAELRARIEQEMFVRRTARSFLDLENRTYVDPTPEADAELAKQLEALPSFVATNFLHEFVRRGRKMPWFDSNFRAMHPHVMPAVLEDYVPSNETR